jgi:hypothetical protein
LNSLIRLLPCGRHFLCRRPARAVVIRSGERVFDSIAVVGHITLDMRTPIRELVAEGWESCEELGHALACMTRPLKRVRVYATDPNCCAIEACWNGSAQPAPIRATPRFPFGGVHLDLTHLAEPPMHAMVLPQPRLERLLDERAAELDADIRRGHEVVGVSQDDATVTADVRGPDGVTARYLVGCDGGHSRVRGMAGIPFPGTTYPEVNRIGQVTMPDSVTRLGNGDLDVLGQGRIRASFTRTDRGVFGFGSLTPGSCSSPPPRTSPPNPTTKRP